MVRVNKNQLSPSDLSALLERFDSAFVGLTKNQTTHVLNELLGTEERLTLAKRLIAIILIREGYSEYRTSCVLKLSHSTTKNIREKLDKGAYDRIISLLTKRKFDYDDFLTSIMSILHLGGILPQRAGLDRYRTLEERRAQYRSPKRNKKSSHR